MSSEDEQCFWLQVTLFLGHKAREQALSGILTLITTEGIENMETPTNSNICSGGTCHFTQITLAKANYTIKHNVSEAGSRGATNIFK